MASLLPSLSLFTLCIAGACSPIVAIAGEGIGPKSYDRKKRGILPFICFMAGSHESFASAHLDSPVLHFLVSN